MYVGIKEKKGKNSENVQQSILLVGKYLDKTHG